MIALISIAFLTGLDNLQVAASLGLTRMDVRRKYMLALMFGLFEGLMPLLGVWLGAAMFRQIPNLEWLGALLLAACGLLILTTSLKTGEARRNHSPWLVLLLPAFLSLDNLLAGAGFGALGYPLAATALTIGLVSSCMCLAGMFLTHQLRNSLPRWVEPLSGAYLMALAAFILLL